MMSKYLEIVPNNLRDNLIAYDLLVTRKKPFAQHLKSVPYILCLEALLKTLEE
jgi:hypothetical protein